MISQRSRRGALTLALLFATAACGGAATPAPTVVPPTAGPPTAVPPTAAPPTAAPPTAVPPTAAPPTAAPTAEPTALAVQKISVMTDFTINAAFGPMLWGTDKGYFSSRGIELDLIPGEGSDDALNQINTDKVDFAFVDMGNYMEQRISGDTPTQAIYALMNISTTGLVSLFEINEPADMAGKSFGTVVFSSGKEKIPEILQANGVDYPGVGEPGSLIELMDFSVLYPTLFEGKIDTAEAGLAGSWESAFVSAREQGKVLYFKPISDWGFLDYSKVMIVRDDLIASDPDLVARMVAAMYESQNDSFANATGADIHKLLLELDPQAEQERVELVWQSFTTYVKNPGPMEASVVQFQLDRLANSDPPITTDLKPEDFFTNEYIPQQ